MFDTNRLTVRRIHPAESKSMVGTAMGAKRTPEICPRLVFGCAPASATYRITKQCRCYRQHTARFGRAAATATQPPRRRPRRGERSAFAAKRALAVSRQLPARVSSNAVEASSPFGLRAIRRRSHGRWLSRLTITATLSTGQAITDHGGRTTRAARSVPDDSLTSSRAGPDESRQRWRRSARPAATRPAP